MWQLSAWIHNCDLNVSDLVVETWQTASRSLLSFSLTRTNTQTDKYLYLIPTLVFL